MKRYIAQFVRGGFPELYHVAERVDGQWIRVGDPKPYHEANDEAEARNAGTWGIAQPITENIYAGWLGGLNLPTMP